MVRSEIPNWVSQPPGRLLITILSLFYLVPYLLSSMCNSPTFIVNFLIFRHFLYVIHQCSLPNINVDVQVLHENILPWFCNWCKIIQDCFIVDSSTYYTNSSYKSIMESSHLFSIVLFNTQVSDPYNNTDITITL